MSDDGDETIDASPEALRAMRDQAASRLAEELEAAKTSAPDEPPVRVWQLGDSDDGVDDLTTDAVFAGDVHDREIDGDDDLTRDLVPENDLTVPLDRAVAEPRVVADVSAGHRGDEDDVTVASLDASAVPERGHLGMADPNEPATPAAPVAPTRDVAAADVPVAAVAASTAGEPGAARDFVREAKERSEKDAREAALPTAKKRRSGLWVVLSVILGAQIIAGGVYLALSSLGDDPELATEIAEAIDPSDPDGVSAAPSNGPLAAPTAAPTPVATPTPVPPTPTWIPVSGGPRSAPFTFVVQATVPEPGVFAGRDGEQLNVEIDGRSIPLVNPLPSGEPLVLRVVGGQPGDEWAQVELPGDATVAWVRSDEFVWDSTTLLVQVDLFTNTLSVFDENNSVFSTAIASGTRDRPTPQISSYIVEDIASANGDVPPRIRLAGFAGRRALADGLGALTIEPTSTSELLLTEDGYATDGRILLNPPDFAAVSGLVSAGARVEILGTPALPVPTPNPQVAAGSTGGSQGGFFGCPPATRGAPPNCYRLVQRLQIPGECAGLQVQIDGDCLLLGGNPELDAFGLNCQANAPTEIGGLCYLKVGLVPQLPGDCPEGSIDVDDECRLPVDAT